MKRFYCRVCKRVKRVRNYPQVISNENSIDVTQRVGVCNYHSGNYRNESISGHQFVEKFRGR